MSHFSEEVTQTRIVVLPNSKSKGKMASLWDGSRSLFQNRFGFVLLITLLSLCGAFIYNESQQSIYEVSTLFEITNSENAKDINHVEKLNHPELIAKVLQNSQLEDLIAIDKRYFHKNSNLSLTERLSEGLEIAQVTDKKYQLTLTDINPRLSMVLANRIPVIYERENGKVEITTYRTVQKEIQEEIWEDVPVEEKAIQTPTANLTTDEQQDLKKKKAKLNQSIGNYQNRVAALNSIVSKRSLKLPGFINDKALKNILSAIRDQKSIDTPEAFQKPEIKSLENHFFSILTRKRDRERSTLNHMIGQRNELRKQIETVKPAPTKTQAIAQSEKKLVIKTKIVEEKIPETKTHQAFTLNFTSPAVLPSFPIKPEKLRNLGIGLGAGLLLGYFISLFLRFEKYKLESLEDIKEATRTPILGVIPSIRKDAA